jgi:hypothetical protein
MVKPMPASTGDGSCVRDREAGHDTGKGRMQPGAGEEGGETDAERRVEEEA